MLDWFGTHSEHAREKDGAMPVSYTHLDSTTRKPRFVKNVNQNG